MVGLSLSCSACNTAPKSTVIHYSGASFNAVDNRGKSWPVEMCTKELLSNARTYYIPGSTSRVLAPSAVKPTAPSDKDAAWVELFEHDFFSDRTLFVRFPLVGASITELIVTAAVGSIGGTRWRFTW